MNERVGSDKLFRGEDAVSYFMCGPDVIYCLTKLFTPPMGKPLFPFLDGYILITVVYSLGLLPCFLDSWDTGTMVHERI